VLLNLVEFDEVVPIPPPVVIMYFEVPGGLHYKLAM